MFANILVPLAQPIIGTLTGAKPNEVWQLDFTRNNDTSIDTPLEFTNYFDDDLFDKVQPGKDSIPTKKREV